MRTSSDRGKQDVGGRVTALEQAVKALDLSREADKKEILKFIDEGAVELMLMGTHGHSRFKELLLGSTTSHVVRKSRIPVLLTR
jgi:nucleotide-binding universal stress UspA family protein